MKVSNVSLAASNKDIQEFFSFSGDIQYVEMQRLAFWISCQLDFHFYEREKIKFKNGYLHYFRETEKSQIAYVTFKDSQGADTALLLTVCCIVVKRALCMIRIISVLILLHLLYLRELL